ncbi:MAG: ribonuclease HII [Chlamydiales bacterium]|nr:ribonuclease HII [Chlamydiales bacterium]
MSNTKWPSKNQSKRQPPNEDKRLLELVELERQAVAKGYRQIAGVDEAGRGPLAGPVVAVACLFKSALFFPGINDSKLLTQKKRKALYEKLTRHPQLLYGVGIIDADVIDEVNILQATLRAMSAAVLKLPERPDYLLVDGNVALSVENIPAQMVIQGDRRSQLIAASSIIAKEIRDELMFRYHALYPEYGFDEHKGYGTEKHRKALARYGPSPIHRKTFNHVTQYAQC